MAGRWERLRAALRAQLAQGATPEKLALSVALGVAIGVSPLLGITTLICLALGVALRLNHPALQLASQAMYVVQVPLLVVFVRLGEWLVGARPATLSASALWLQLREAPAVVLAQLGRSGLHGFLGWVVTAPLVALAVYGAFLPLFRRRDAVL